MSPRVSILLPVYDAAATLSACLRSIARQRLGDYECVAVDDGSRDASGELLRRAAAHDSRIRILSRPHLGLVPSLEAGVHACRGRYVARMDADDWMHRERLAAQTAVLDADPRLDAVGCHVRIFPRQTLGQGMRNYETWLASIDSARRVREEAFVECPIAHPTWMIRRETLASFGYRDRGWPEDYDLLLRLLTAGRGVGVVPRRLLGWRNRPGRLSRVDSRYGIDRFTACKAEHLASGFLAGSPHYALWGYGATGRTLRRALACHGKTPSAILELHPGRLGNRIHGAPVLRPADWLETADTPLVVSVAGAEARGRIRGELRRTRWVECRDYVCAA